MKKLLLAIERELQGQQVDVPAGNISIVPDLSYIPLATSTPAFCIKDGSVTTEELSGGVERVTMVAYVVVWVRILEKAGTSVIGNDDDKGVLDLAGTACRVLNDNMLEIKGMDYARCGVNRASELMGAKTTTLQRQILEFRYIKETEGICGY